MVTTALTARFRPRLEQDLPLLRRNDQELQLGIEPGRGAVLSSVSAEFDRLIAGLDGVRTLAELRSEAIELGLDPDHLVAVLTRLHRAELLTDGPAPSPEALVQTAAVRVIGAGPLGRAIGNRLVEAGVARIRLCDPDPVDPSLYPGARLRISQAQALRSELLDRAHAVGRALSVDADAHWSGLAALPRAVPRGPRTNASRADQSQTLGRSLTIIAANTAEADRAISDVLLRADLPHLVVRCVLGGMVLGPLVLPGQTPCLSCLDLTRLAGDAAWPALLAQLSRRIEHPTPSLLDWAAATTVLQVLGWSADGRAETIGSTLELSGRDFHLRVRRWRLHPSCGCRWSGTARWGA